MTIEQSIKFYNTGTRVVKALCGVAIGALIYVLTQGCRTVGSPSPVTTGDITVPIYYFSKGSLHRALVSSNIAQTVYSRGVCITNSLGAPTGYAPTNQPK